MCVPNQYRSKGRKNRARNVLEESLISATECVYVYTLVDCSTTNTHVRHVHSALFLIAQRVVAALN